MSTTALAVAAVLTPLAPAVLNPSPATIVTCAAVSALVAAVVAQRRRRWVTWTGAGLLTLLAVSAALALAGFTLADAQAEAASPLAGEWEAALRGGALRIMPVPWYANDLLVLASACLITAILLAALALAAPRPARDTA